MSFHFVLDRMDRVTDNGIHLRPIEAMKDGVLFQRMDANDVTIKLSHTEIAEKFASQNWIHERHYYSRTNVDLRARDLDLKMSNATPSERFQGSVRAHFCDIYIAFHADGRMKKTDSSYMACRDEIQQKVLEYCERYFVDISRTNSGVVSLSKYTLPKARRARDLVNLYIESGLKVSSLIPRWRKCGNRSLRQAVEARYLLNKAVMEYATLRKPQISHVKRETERLFREENARRKVEGERHLKCPGLKAISRAVNRIDPFAAYARRFGLDAANNFFAFSENGIRADFPMQRIEIDEWVVDVTTLFETTAVVEMLDGDVRKALPRGRRYLTLAIDCATRCVVGIKISATAGSTEVVQVLEQMTRNKDDIAKAFGYACDWPMGGNPFEILHDNGPALIAPGPRRVTNDLGAEITTTPAGVARLRSRVERIFRTFGTEVMPLLTARNFGSIAEKGAFDPGKFAALTDDELTQILVLFIVDVYHNREHRGLLGETPANCWRRLSAIHTPAPVDLPTRRAIFGLEINCKLGKRGVRFAALDYVCKELREHVKRSWEREFRIRVDPLDLGFVSIEIGGVWFPAKCVKPGFDGVAWGSWQSQLKAFRTKHKHDAQLTLPFVDSALLLIANIDRAANVRQSLTEYSVTQGQIQWEEDKTNLGLSIDFREDDLEVLDHEDGLFGEVINPLTESRSETIEWAGTETSLRPPLDGLPGTSWSIDDE